MKKINFYKIMVLLVGLMLTFTFTGCGDAENGPTGGGGDDDIMGSVTVNNLPAIPPVGFTVNVFPNPGYTISSNNNFQAALTGGSTAAGNGTSSPVEIVAPKGWNNSGSYLVVVTINAEIRFKQAVQFSSGSATVDWATLTRLADLPENTGNASGTPGVLTIEGFTGNGTVVYIYNYSGSGITSQLQYATVIATPALATGNADNGTAEISLYEGYSEIPFDETGIFLVTIGVPNPARENAIEQRFKTAVQFTDGGATITFSSMIWMKDLSVM